MPSIAGAEAAGRSRPWQADVVRRLCGALDPGFDHPVAETDRMVGVSDDAPDGRAGTCAESPRPRTTNASSGPSYREAGSSPCIPPGPSTPSRHLRVSPTFTPTNRRPSAANSARSSSSTGMLVLHGGHQLPQKSRRTTYPRRSESWMVSPVKRFGRAKSGARSPISTPIAGGSSSESTETILDTLLRAPGIVDHRQGRLVGPLQRRRRASSSAPSPVSPSPKRPLIQDNLSVRIHGIMRTKQDRKRGIAGARRPREDRHRRPVEQRTPAERAKQEQTRESGETTSIQQHLSSPPGSHRIASAVHEKGCEALATQEPRACFQSGLPSRTRSTVPVLCRFSVSRL